MTAVAEPVQRTACAFCERTNRPTTPTETKRHGRLNLCDACKRFCARHGWLKEE